MKHLLGLFLGPVVFVMAVDTAEFFVSTHGGDTATGSRTQPFAKSSRKPWAHSVRSMKRRVVLPNSLPRR